MFTGIVADRGVIAEVSGDDLRRITVSSDLDGLQVGDSVAVDGICLTVVEADPGAFAVEAVPETLARTTLGARNPGDGVNLERPMAADGRFDGHIVQGHVDGVAIVRSVAEEGGGARMAFDLDAGLLRYVVEKGSVTLDGVSLTVADIDQDGFAVAVIPHTLAVTTLGERAPGDGVNIEVDLVAKYVERLVQR